MIGMEKGKVGKLRRMLTIRERETYKIAKSHTKANGQRPKLLVIVLGCGGAATLPAQLKHGSRPKLP